MPVSRIRASLRSLVPLAAAGATVLLTGFAAQAQDVGSFFEMLFGAGPRARPPAPYYYGEAPRRRDPGLRYAALPRSDLVKPDALSGRQPVDQKAIQADPGGAILKDPTLRAGDIVIMPSGPMVFTGAPAKRHHAGEFEDIKHSRQIDTTTRRKLLAMMVPMGALPADQARKVVAAKRRLAPQQEIDAADAAARADAKPRVISPWAASPAPTD